LESKDNSPLIASIPKLKNIKFQDFGLHPSCLLCVEFITRLQMSEIPTRLSTYLPMSVKFHHNAKQYQYTSSIKCFNK
jgi:hypothetical protein